MKTHEKLKVLFKEKGRGSQIALARLLNEDKGFVSRWVSGKQTIPKAKLKNVANYFGVTIDYLLDDNQELPLSRFIPIIGTASCGVPTEHFYDSDVTYLPVTPDVNVSTSYAVVADGNSMLHLIADGDIVICDTSKPPSDNVIVHYTIDDTSGIKRIKRQSDGSVLLLPDNATCENCNPIVIVKERIVELYTARCIKIFKNL